MDMFNLAQLTKHVVVRGVKDADKKDPYLVVKEAVRDTLKTYLKGMIPGNSEVQQGVREVARGAMTAALLSNLEMTLAAVSILRAVGDMAPELPHDPELLMVATLEGVADIRLLISIDVLAQIQSAVEREYMGCGEVFRTHLEKRNGLHKDERTVKI